MQRAKPRSVYPCVMVLLSSLVLLCLLLPSWAWAGQQLSGKVTFVSGDATVWRDAKAHSLAAADPIHEGDRLTTGADGFVHLRMVDGALLSLRSDSAITIAHYRYTPDQPDASRVNLTLHHGVVRSISGEIGARSREHFRLETPIAAIGIRGTDFSILSLDEVSRLSLARGGVVMAPLSSECRRGGVGPCDSSGAVELFDTQRNMLLETRLGDRAAQLTRDGITPDELRPPHPAESTLSPIETAMPHKEGVQLLTGDSLPGSRNYEEALEQANRYMEQTGLIAEAVKRGNAASEIQPRDQGRVAQPTILWGRWSEFVDDETREVARLLHGDHQPRRYATVNSVFGMVENSLHRPQLPDAGKAYFDLNRYEAYVKRGEQLETASISHPGLVVDFEQQRFAARLDVHADSLPGAIPVVGGGKLTQDGYLLSDSQSPSQLAGVLGNAAAEAGLLFEYQIEPGVDAVGATHWVLEHD